MNGLTLMRTSCTACGLPMVLEWTGFNVGPGAPQHANCLHTRLHFEDQSQRQYYSPEDQQRIEEIVKKYGSNNDQRVTQQDPGPGQMPEEPADLAQKTASMQPEPAMTHEKYAGLMNEHYREGDGN